MAIAGTDAQAIGHGKNITDSGTLTLGDKVSEVRAFVLNFGNADDPVRIIAAEAGEGARAPHGWYTLDGMKLDKRPTGKGMYIYNGKKVVITRTK